MEEKRKPPKKTDLAGREGGREGGRERDAAPRLLKLNSELFLPVFTPGCGKVTVQAQQAEPQMFLETSSCKIS